LFRGGRGIVLQANGKGASQLAQLLHKKFERDATTLLRVRGGRRSFQAWEDKKRLSTVIDRACPGPEGKKRWSGYFPTASKLIREGSPGRCEVVHLWYRLHWETCSVEGKGPVFFSNREEGCHSSVLLRSVSMLAGGEGEEREGGVFPKKKERDNSPGK